MEIPYSEINNRLLSYFLENKTFCGQIALTIDENEVKSLFPERRFEALVKTIGSFWKANCWQKSWKGKMSFGIIGLQGTAAYDFNGLSNETSIRSNLQRLLGYSTNELTELFEGNCSQQGQTFQDKLWNGAKTYLQQEYQLILDIPEPKTDSYRFVQYPAYQILFTKKELRSFTKIFDSQGLYPGLPISRETFRKRIFDSWRKHERGLFARTRRLLEKQNEKENLFINQLYQYFNDWDGTVYNFQYGEIISSKNSNSKHILTAEYLDEVFVFSWYKPGLEEYNAIDVDSFFKGFPAMGKFGLLQLESGYTNVYSQQERYVEKGRPLLLIFRLDRSYDNHRFFKYRSIIAKKKKDCQKLIENVYACRFEGVEEMKKYIDLGIEEASASPVQLQFGLKTGYRTYLQGCGPSIHTVNRELPITIFRVGHPPFNLNEYDPEIAPAGKYIIIAAGHPQTSFYIINKSRTTAQATGDRGWDYKSWSLQMENYDIAGCLISEIPTTSGQGLVREWIKIQTQANYHSSINTPLIKALNQSKYG